MYNLAAAVRALAPEAYDSHLFALEVRARTSSNPSHNLSFDDTLQARLRELDRGAES